MQTADFLVHNVHLLRRKRIEGNFLGLSQGPEMAQLLRSASNGTVSASNYNYASL